MFIEDAKEKVLLYSDNTVILLLPNRECMRETNEVPYLEAKLK